MRTLYVATHPRGDAPRRTRRWRPMTFCSARKGITVLRNTDRSHCRTMMFLSASHLEHQ